MDHPTHAADTKKSDTQVYVQVTYLIVYYQKTTAAWTQSLLPMNKSNNNKKQGHLAQRRRGAEAERGRGAPGVKLTEC